MTITTRAGTLTSTIQSDYTGSGTAVDRRPTNVLIEAYFRSSYLLTRQTPGVPSRVRGSRRLSSGRNLDKNRLAPGHAGSMAEDLAVRMQEECGRCQGGQVSIRTQSEAHRLDLVNIKLPGFSQSSMFSSAPVSQTGSHRRTSRRIAMGTMLNKRYSAEWVLLLFLDNVVLKR